MKNIIKLHSNFFLILLIIGIVLSVAIRLYYNDVQVLGSVLAMASCAACMVVYAFIIGRDTSGLHNPDNCYYMGLLLTLVSLIYSLVTLFFLKNDAGVDERTYNLIGSFGIALFSTFLGILLRILLLQIEYEKGGSPDGANAHVVLNPEDDLSETAFQLRCALTQTIADMNVFRGAIITSVQETHREAEELRVETTKQFKKTTNEQTKILSALFTTATSKLAEVGDGITDSAAQMQELLDGLLTKVTSDGLELSSSIKEILESLQETVDYLKPITQHAHIIFANHDALNASLQKTTEILTSIDLHTTAKVFSKINEVTGYFAASINQIPPLLTQAIENMKVIQDAVVKSAEETHNEAGKIREEITNQFTKTTAEQIEILSTFSTTTVSQLSKVSDGIADSAIQIKESLDRFAIKTVDDEDSVSAEQILRSLQQNVESLAYASSGLTATLDKVVAITTGNNSILNPVLVNQ